MEQNFSNTIRVVLHNLPFSLPNANDNTFHLWYISIENELVQQAVAQNGSEVAPQLAAQIVSISWGHPRRFADYRGNRE